MKRPHCHCLQLSIHPKTQFVTGRMSICLREEDYGQRADLHPDRRHTLVPCLELATQHPLLNGNRNRAGRHLTLARLLSAMLVLSFLGAISFDIAIFPVTFPSIAHPPSSFLLCTW